MFDNAYQPRTLIKAEAQLCKEQSAVMESQYWKNKLVCHYLYYYHLGLVVKLSSRIGARKFINTGFRKAVCIFFFFEYQLDYFFFCHQLITVFSSGGIPVPVMALQVILKQLLIAPQYWMGKLDLWKCGFHTKCNAVMDALSPDQIYLSLFMNSDCCILILLCCCKYGYEVWSVHISCMQP